MPQLSPLPKQPKIHVPFPSHAVPCARCHVALSPCVSPPRENNREREELEEMLEEGKRPMNFTLFLTLFGEKLNGTGPEESILNTFRLFPAPSTRTTGPSSRRFTRLLLTQAEKFSLEEVEQLLAVTPVDVSGDIDYKSLCYIVTHGDKKED
ncbi:unnamed protein product [Bubo scandiacus]